MSARSPYAGSTGYRLQLSGHEHPLWPAGVLTALQVGRCKPALVFVPLQRLARFRREVRGCGAGRRALRTTGRACHALTLIQMRFGCFLAGPGRTVARRISAQKYERYKTHAGRLRSHIRIRVLMCARERAHASNVVCL